ncbi:hypothetical protein AN0962.2 [Aspergillus nidulans FGSC A4]|uniref:PyrC n=1 Tax=Emericella nidulans TaxID=162425 RepID=P79038_EMEND|nr:pyrC [Aspergillus nidulans]EAA65991.1 hypothetical protein AN0962.2 [Aspergillus nidulans FGSC A4]|eukprot:XP_658566.1 hypothetical protein AN0962.2 [Aspergillus nidulans FGSC A4]
MTLSKLQGVKLPASADFHGAYEPSTPSHCYSQLMRENSPPPRWGHDGIGYPHHQTRWCQHSLRYGKEITLLGDEKQEMKRCANCIDLIRTPNNI